MRTILTATLLGVVLWACSDGSGSGSGSGSGADGGSDSDTSTGGSIASGGTEGGSGGSSNGVTSSGGAAGALNQAGAAGGGNEGGAGFDFESCATSEQEGVLTPANLLFVIDRSGSMNCNAPETGQSSASCEVSPEKEFPDEPSKWEIVSEALSTALADLVGRRNVSAGVVMFPRVDAENECAVSTEPDVAIASLNSGHKQDIDDFLEAVEPGGRTPIAGSTLTSYQYLADALRAEQLAGNTFVVLLTDGRDTCDGEQRPEVVEAFVDTHVPNATEFNISTFVIGAPGSEVERRLLSQIAWAGETPSSPSCDHEASEADVGDCHFDMTTTDDFASELGDALTRITEDRTLSCVFDVPTSNRGQAVDLNKVNIEFTPSDGEPIPILKDTRDCAEGAEGWQYSADFSQIFLCGEICEQVKADPGGEVKIFLGCKTEIVK